MNTNAINIKDLNFSFKMSQEVLKVLDSINICLNGNEFVSLIGPSGCGKTTLLKILGDLINNKDHNILSGEVLINDKSPSEARLKHQIGFAFQDSVLLPWRKVIDNLKLPLELIKEKDFNYWDADELLEIMGLSDFRNSYPNQLSGGMKQRLAIARALIYQPSILLMDEPFGAVDASTREDLNIELLKIWDFTNATIVFVTHSISEAVFLSDRVITLTSRPAKIQHELEIKLERPRDIRVKETPEFIKFASILRNELEKARGDE